MTPVVAVADPRPPADDLALGFSLLRQADYRSVLDAWSRVLAEHPSHEHADEIRDGMVAVARLQAMLEKWHDV